MPEMDGTGPAGYGPMGFGLGPCGRGARGGFKRLFGLRFKEPAEFTKEDKKKILEAELKQIEAEKQEIEKEIKGLK